MMEREDGFICRKKKVSILSIVSSVLLIPTVIIGFFRSEIAIHEISHENP